MQRISRPKKPSEFIHEAFWREHHNTFIYSICTTTNCRFQCPIGFGVSSLLNHPIGLSGDQNIDPQDLPKHGIHGSLPVSGPSSTFIFGLWSVSLCVSWKGSVCVGEKMCVTICSNIHGQVILEVDQYQPTWGGREYSRGGQWISFHPMLNEDRSLRFWYENLTNLHVPASRNQWCWNRFPLLSLISCCFHSLETVTRWGGGISR